MTVNEACIKINLAIQGINSYLEEDIHHEEICSFLNTTLLQLLDNFTDYKPDIDKLELNPQLLKYFDLLYIKNKEILTPSLITTVDSFYQYDLDNLGSTEKCYLLLKSRSKVSISCKVNGVSTTKTKLVKNRLKRTDDLDDALNSSLFKTDKNSPIAHIYDNILNVYKGSDFTITAFYLDYIKIPPTISYGVSGSDNIPLSEQGALFLVNNTIDYILKIQQQNQQKIVNLTPNTK